VPHDGRPPVDWRGPGAMALDPRGQPPPDWRGPSDMPRDWRGPPGPHSPPGMYPPPRSAADPRWSYPPGGPMGRPGPCGDYGWPPHGMPPPGPEPPGEWRGPSPRHAPPYAPRPGDPSVDLWASRAGYPGGYQQPSAGFGCRGHEGHGGPGPGGELERLLDSKTGRGAEGPGPGFSAGNLGPAGGPTREASSGCAGACSSRTPGAGADDEEEEPPAPFTPADRFRGVRIAWSALSQGLQARLRAAGVPSDRNQAPRSSAAATEPGRALDQEAAAAQRRCSRLGLDCPQRSRAPQPMPTPPRLPVCTLELSHAGLWERFREKCGTAAPTDAAVPCELRKSRGGGSVLAPMLVAASGAEALQKR